MLRVVYVEQVPLLSAPVAREPHGVSKLKDSLLRLLSCCAWNLSIFTIKDHLLLLRLMRVGRILICVYNTNKDSLLLLLLLDFHE